MADDVERAVAALKAGQPVVFPTDTVYGLGVAVSYAASPQLIYDVKRRDAGKPVAWLVGGVEALDRYGSGVPGLVRELAHRHWPGPLTLIVKASAAVPDAFRSPRGTIGLRMPANDTALSLIKAVGPIAASSANLSGEPAPRRFADIASEVRGAVGAAIRADEPGSGIASAVIDCSRGEMVVLREGPPL